MNGTVYFVQRGGPDGLIKIGFTSRPVLARLMVLRTALRLAGLPEEPMEPLASTPGSTRLERELQARFASARAHGDWFRPVPGLLNFIAEIKATAPPDSRLTEPLRVACSFCGALPGDECKTTDRLVSGLYPGMPRHPHAARHRALRATPKGGAP